MKINIKKETLFLTKTNKTIFSKKQSSQPKKQILFIFTLSLPILIIYINSLHLQANNIAQQNKTQKLNTLTKTNYKIYENIIYYSCKKISNDSQNLDKIQQTSKQLLTQKLKISNLYITKFNKIYETKPKTTHIINKFFEIKNIFPNNIHSMQNFYIYGIVPYKTIIKYTEDLPSAKQKIIQKGKNGYIKAILHKLMIKNTKNYSTTCKQIEKLELKNYTKPISQIILKGKQPIIRKINIGGKQITYYRTLKVWATSYDSSCKGCNNITATGRTLTYGIIAVDPKVIPLHTCMYVPGYGYGQAEDVGGAIKGNHIDLAFDNIKHGWWSARFVNIYLVNCKDAKLPWDK